MTRSEPVSILLPTFEWGPVCDDLVEQLQDGDELLIICDTDDNPIATKETPEQVSVLTAGKPEGCSGKANAIAYGMREATNDRYVWTDDDFDHSDGWLDELLAEGSNSPATSVPVFCGDKFWRILEPLLILSITTGIYFDMGFWSSKPWAGGVTFREQELSDDVDALINDLETCLSDDGVLGDHLETVTPVTDRLTMVDVPGDFESVVDRSVRFTRIAYIHDESQPLMIASVTAAALCILFPIPAFVTLTAVAAAVYQYFGIERTSVAYTYLTTLISPFILFSGVFVKEFEWAGRTYRVDDWDQVTVGEE